MVVSRDAAQAYQEAWTKASTRTRLDAAIAHEYEELRASATPELRQRYNIEWPHYVAVALAPETSLLIADEAREMLRLYRSVLELE